jgi:hypothetical protein
MKVLLNSKTSKVFCVNFFAYFFYFKDCFNQTKTRSSFVFESRKNLNYLLKRAESF